MPSMDLPLPDGLPPWLAAFVLEAQCETETLRENGAEQAGRDMGDTVNYQSDGDPQKQAQLIDAAVVP